MDRPAHQRGDPAPFYWQGTKTGCLLLHGFTGSPAEMRLLGEHLAEKGLTVEGPLLPGHGATLEALNQVSWQDWYHCAEEHLLRLCETCDRVFVGGLSMGTLLALYLAARHPQVGGLLLYSPAIKVKDRLLPLSLVARYFLRQVPSGADSDLLDPDAAERLWHYGAWPVAGAAQFYLLQRTVRRELDQVRAPTLIFYSTHDGSLHPDAPRLLMEGIASEDKEVVTLQRSGHCMTVDGQRGEIFERSWGFVVGHVDAG